MEDFEVLFQAEKNFGPDTDFSCTFKNQPTNSIQHRPSLEANHRSAGQEIISILYNPKVHTVFTSAHHWSLP
jgi:hypothetical protein